MSDEFVEDEDWEYPAPEGPTEATAEAPPKPIPEPEAPRQPDEWMRAIEAVLMAATEPVEPQMLAQLIERPVAEVEGLCAILAAECSGRGFVLAKVAGGYRFQTHPELAPYVERYLLEGRHARLSNAALETLAVIAYKQPVTRSQLSAVRGVDVDGVVRGLLERGYIEELGREDGPGHPVRYGTTRLFLERLGIESLDKLPPLADLVPGADVLDDLETRLREAARPTRPPALRRRRTRARRPGPGQASLEEAAASGEPDDASP
jgi:segregation and condensation protein B